MKVRGRRVCADCGERWSYYETGEISCPSCGGMRSTGVGERALHTDGIAEFDLTPIRAGLDRESLGDVAGDIVRRCREYTTARGFVDSGALLPLDGTYLAATELRYAIEGYDRSIRPERFSGAEDMEEYYLLSLLRGADRGDRPSVEEVPESMYHARGLACASAVEEYRRDLRRWLDEQGGAVEVDELLGRIGDHRRRIEALDGEVDPDTGDRLVEAVRDLTRYLTEEDEAALLRAEERLDRIV
ncbi:DUF7117 family protein [Natronorarus salvus]|uniref:DUF7117 family protein n=1 Tax=Natronorarus salvus TaxID=3117733 RepID=UPI002F26B9F9